MPIFTAPDRAGSLARVTEDSTRPSVDGPDELAVPDYLDTSKASVARVYDAFLGGKDNYEIDREIVRATNAVVPGSKIARENRAWLIRAVRLLAATAGVDQFIDCGAGLPAAGASMQSPRTRRGR